MQWSLERDPPLFRPLERRESRTAGLEQRKEIGQKKRKSDGPGLICSRHLEGVGWLVRNRFFSRTQQKDKFGWEKGEPKKGVTKIKHPRSFIRENQRSAFGAIGDSGSGGEGGKQGGKENEFPERT